MSLGFIDHYKKYAMLENVELSQAVNLFIKFLNGLPLVKRLFSGKYKWYGLKRFLFALRPFFRMIFQWVMSYAAMFAALIFTGTIFSLMDKALGTNYNVAGDLIDSASAGSFAFLAFYLSQAFLANRIINTAPFIKMLYDQWRMHPKSIALSHSFFAELRTAIGRGLAFGLVFFLRDYPGGFKSGLLISFMIMFIAMIMTAFHLYIFDTRRIKIENKVIYYLVLFVVFFIGLLNLKTINQTIFAIIFILLLILYIISSRYIFSYDKYENILGGVKTYEQMQADFKKEYEKKFEAKASISNEKIQGSGYELLNNLFFDRYRDPIIKPIIKKQLIIFGISMAALVYLYKFDMSPDIVGKYLPVIIPFLSLMMFGNEKMTEMLFSKCDKSLMQYNFYRLPESLEFMYKLRYKKLLKFNLPGIFLVLLIVVIASLAYSIPQSKMFILISFILISGLFFVGDTLALYYMFQPYNDGAKIIGSKYKRFKYIESYGLLALVPILLKNLGYYSTWILGAIGVLMVLFIMLAPRMIRKFGPKNFRIQK